MKRILISVCLILMAAFMYAQDSPLNIIVLGAHPDDCEGDAGGLAALYARMGHNVKIVSLTNGDAGHYDMGGGVLAKVRMAEAEEAGKRLGVKDYVVMDNHDGELMPTLENRLKVIREIRKWNADIVIGPRPNDYHPDHRYTAILMQDAAFMVVVPNIAPDVPALKKNPVFLYAADRFQKPNPFPKSIYDNIAYGPKIHGIRDKKILDEIVETSLRGAAIWDEVKDRLKENAYGLSGGQQQRLCIARCLAIEPDVILMDEPTSALDPISTLKVEELIQELKKRFSIIIVTHNMQQAARISDKTAFFLSGEVIEFSNTEKIFSNPLDKRTEDYITGRFG